MVDSNVEHHQYKVKYSLNGKEQEEWFSAADLTSETRAQEKEKHYEGVIT